VITFFESGDWIQVFLDEKLVYEGHQIDLTHDRVLDILHQDYRVIELTDEDMIRIERSRKSLHETFDLLNIKKDEDEDSVLLGEIRGQQ